MILRTADGGEISIPHYEDTPRPIIAPPSAAFLEELIERARRHGWSADYIEIAKFLEHLCELAGADVPYRERQNILEPYTSSYDEHGNEVYDELGNHS